MSKYGGSHRRKCKVNFVTEYNCIRCLSVHVIHCKAVNASRHVYLILDQIVREIKIRFYLPICSIWRLWSTEYYNPDTFTIWKRTYCMQFQSYYVVPCYH